MRATELQAINSALMSRDKLFALLRRDAGIFREGDLSYVRGVLGEMAIESTVIDLPLLVAELNNRKHTLDVRALVADLARSSVCVEYDALLNRMEETHRREVIRCHAADLLAALERGERSYDEIIDKLIAEYNGTSDADEYADLFEYLNANDLDNIFASLSPLKTGVWQLDAVLRGIYAGQLIMIAARPGQGKSTFAIQIMRCMEGHKFFFSLEMTRQEIYSKMLSAVTSIECGKILFNRLDDAERVIVAQAHTRERDKHSVTLFDGVFDLARIVYYVNHMSATKKPSVIFIDYLQLIAGAEGENQNIRVSTISRTLKLLAMKHRVPIIAMSQMSREIEKANREPLLSDLRDSGSLEQNSNIVIFLHENKDGEHYPIVAKNRMGKTGRVRGLVFEKEFSRFGDEGGISEEWYK